MKEDEKIMINNELEKIHKDYNDLVIENHENKNPLFKEINKMKNKDLEINKDFKIKRDLEILRTMIEEDNEQLGIKNPSFKEINKLKDKTKKVVNKIKLGIDKHIEGKVLILEGQGNLIVVENIQINSINQIKIKSESRHVMIKFNTMSLTLNIKVNVSLNITELKEISLLINKYVLSLKSKEI
jgi:hypothetical protein